MFGEAVGVEGSAGGRAVSLDTLHRQGPAYGPDGAALGGAAVLRLQLYGPLCRGGQGGEGGGANSGGNKVFRVQTSSHS